MTARQARADAIRRLKAAGVTYTKVQARTVEFSDLARAAPVFVEITGADPKAVTAVFADVPKPSEGGYIVRVRGGVVS